MSCGNVNSELSYHLSVLTPSAAIFLFSIWRVVVDVHAVIPTNKTACQGDFTTFWCTRRFGSTIFWFVDDQPINSLPKVYGAVSTSFVSVGELSSKLRILALEETNNSMITCAVASSTKISNFTEPVYLTVIEKPLPPTGLRIDTHGGSSNANITWDPVNTTTSEVLYTVTVSVTNTSEVSRINTSDTHLEYTFENCCCLQSINFSVNVTVSSLIIDSSLCPESEPSKAKGLSDLREACINAYTRPKNCATQLFHGVQLLISLAVLVSLNAHQP